MIEQETQPHVCYSCDEEFVVTTPYETEASVEFCPFCGSDVEGDQDTLIFDEEEDEDGLLGDD
jgi:predicted RNA-binding Zn-ribbon protein involved in translation (DUF1610 family)